MRLAHAQWIPIIYERIWLLHGHRLREELCWRHLRRSVRYDKRLNALKEWWRFVKTWYTHRPCCWEAGVLARGRHARRILIHLVHLGHLVIKLRRLLIMTLTRGDGAQEIMAYSSIWHLSMRILPWLHLRGFHARWLWRKHVLLHAILRILLAWRLWHSHIPRVAAVLLLVALRILAIILRLLVIVLWHLFVRRRREEIMIELGLGIQARS